MRMLPFSILMISGLLAAPLHAATPTADDASAVRKPLEAYLKGGATGDGAFMRQAFLPTAHIEGIRKGEFVSRPIDEYIAGFDGKPAADEAQRKRSIDVVDVTGNAAMARVTLDFPNGTITDYFVLLKVDGEWKIANKVWDWQPKQPAT